jgi:PAS domain S-box-containing protein
MSKPDAKFRFLAFLVFMTFCLPGSANATPVLHRVVLQLPAQHKFEFAGYYAALEKGYYRKAGLDVRFREPESGQDPLSAVVNGEADFGVGSSDLVILRGQGKPVVALAVIFQHSPQVLLLRKGLGLRTALDLTGKTILFERPSAEVLAYLKSEGTPLDSLVLTEHPNRVEEFIRGGAAAMTARAFDEPQLLDQRGVEYDRLTPRSGGVDFYDGCLFTTQAQIDSQPKRVRDFLEASLQGWVYAMEHPYELIETILAQYSQRRGREYLVFEATKARQLIHSDLLEIGYMSSSRWKSIVDAYAALGLAPAGLSLNGFLYEHDPLLAYRWLMWPAVLGVGLLCVAIFVATRFFRLNRRLKINIEQRDKAECELRAREKSEREARELLEVVLANMAQALAVADADYRLVAHNDRFKRFFGFSDQDLRIGVAYSALIETWASSFNRESREVQAALTALGRPDDFSVTYQQRHPVLGLTWIEMHHNPLPQGGFVRTFTDVTERKRAEALLAASEKRYHALLETAPMPVVITSLQDNRVLFVNERASVFFGVSQEQVIGKQMDEYWRNIEDQARLRELLNVKERVTDFEACLRTQEGFSRWVNVSSAVTSFGETPAQFSAFHDITERKRMEERLAESEEFHRAIIDAAPVGIVVADNAGRLAFYSQKAGELYGAPSEYSMIGTLLADWVHPVDRERARERLANYMNGELQVANAEYLMQRYDGSTFWGSNHSSLYYDAAGKPKGVLTIVSDLTQRKFMEAELLAAKEAAEAANRAKSAFLANMSHEIRTPMNAIVGLSQLCLKTQTTPKQRDYLDKVLAAADTLLALVNDVLDLSKIEAGKMEMESSLFRFGLLWSNIEDILGHKATEKGLAFSMCSDSEIPDFINGDALRLQQILLNLGGNAVKFTEKGEVRISVKLVARKGDTIRLRFEVQDSGPGVEPELLPKLFLPFTQADPAVTRKYGGTGLGLAICKRLAEIMGGVIEASSETGKGSLFALVLDFEAATSDEVEAVCKIPGLFSSSAACASVESGALLLEGARVLLVEDNEINMQVAQEMLLQCGAQAVSAYNGREALDILAGDQDFDAALLDIQMPVLDGYETARTIREALGLSDLPLIAMTAHAFAAEREKCLAAGMNDHLTKPVMLDTLQTTLARWIKRPIPSRAGLSQAPSSTSAPAPALEATRCLDFPALQQRLRADSSIALAILRQFRKEHQNASSRVRDFLARGETGTAKKIMHTLKGVAGNLAAEPLTAAVAELDAQLAATLRGALDPPSLEGPLKRFEDELSALCAEIERLDSLSS